MSRYAMAVIAAMLFSIISSTTAHAQEYRIEPVVIEGDPAPGFPGANLARFHNDVILNNSGEILFKSGIDSDPADLGIWIVRENGIFPVAISGDIVPVDAKGAATDFQFSFFGKLALNDRGIVSFHAFGTNSQGIILDQFGDQKLLAQTGDEAPGTDGETFFRFSRSASPGSYFGPILNSLDQVVFPGFLDTDLSNDSGIWFWNGQDLLLLAREGDAAPGTVDKIIGPPENPRLNGAGHVAFRASVEPRGQHSGIWLGPPEDLIPVVLSGDLAPGTGGGKFSLIGNVDLNASGKIVFNSFMDNVDIDFSEGIWTGDDDSLSLVVREGDEIPGGSGRTFRFFRDPVLNDFGDIAFNSQLDDSDTTTDESLWAVRKGTLIEIAREGSLAPGTDMGTFGRLISIRPIISNAGEVAFAARSSVLHPESVNGLWVGPPGNLRLIVRSGDVLEVSPGRFLKVSWVVLEGDDGGNRRDGPHSGFNDLGQVAFWVRFEDDSTAIFLATPLRADLWLEQRARRIAARNVRLTLTVHSAPGCRAAEPEVCGFGATVDAENVVLTDHLPLNPGRLEVVSLPSACGYDQGSHTVTCQAALLPRDSSVSVAIEVRLTGAGGGLANAVNTATVSSDTFDPNLDNNTVTLPRSGS